MSLSGVLYAIFIGILLPASSVLSYFKLKDVAKLPSKPLLRLEALIMHALMFLFAWWVWRSLRQPIFPEYTVQWRHLGAGLGALIVFVCGMFPMWKSNSVGKRDRVYRSAPQALSEMPGWIAVSFTAGYVEEFAYRGVLFGILFYWIPNWWAAALICAAVFAVGHGIQGWKGVLIIFAMSAIFHGLVWYTGTLYVAMTVHAIYDTIAGFAYLRLYKQPAPEVSSVAPASVV